MNPTKDLFCSETQRNIDMWLEGEYDLLTKDTIRQLLLERPQELADAFYQTLSFGTGGLRGVMGVGTNRMNVYTVRGATQGLAHYILKQPDGQGGKKVCIGFDCRKNSQAFALEAAQVLAAHGIEVYLFKQLRPLAMICFGIRFYTCIAGIMITASHNPPQYNGYKVFWSSGGQILPPHDKGILTEIKKVIRPSDIKREAFPHPLIHEVDEEVDHAYVKTIARYQLIAEETARYGAQLKIVYTSLHGTGITMVPQTLRSWGFKNLDIVEKQAQPDGDFQTVKSPNPEEHAALELGIQQLQTGAGDILLATDPDTDRLGVVVMHQGNPFIFDGQQVACLLLEHTCRSLKNRGDGLACIKTIVTTELFAKIASHYSLKCVDLLTGFKYIGAKIDEWEELKSRNLPAPTFLLGAEESYGYLIGTYVQDKDAIGAAARLCEAALSMKLQGKTLVDLLYEIYTREGVHRERLLSLSFEGKEGIKNMKQIMQQLRKSPPYAVGNQQVIRMEDYLAQISLDIPSGRCHTLNLPQADVLRFWLKDGSKIVIRPSGTEPKMKIYCAVADKRKHLTGSLLQEAIHACDRSLESLHFALKALIQI